MTLIDTIEGCPIILNDSGIISFTAKAAIDGDGSGGNSYHDPDFQPDTSLHNNGLPLNAETEHYIVVPPAIIQSVPSIILGSQAYVTFLGRTQPAVVGDIGPHDKLGEISIALAQALGIPPSPISGGISSHIVQYSIHPGSPATVNNTSYSLQPS
jgi:hypothetical protein